MDIALQLSTLNETIWQQDYDNFFADFQARMTRLWTFSNRIERRDSKFSQSPHCSVNCFQHLRSSDPGAIVCISCATHRALHMICTRLHPGHLSVGVGGSSRRSEQIVKISRQTMDTVVWSCLRRWVLYSHCLMIMFSAPSILPPSPNDLVSECGRQKIRNCRWPS